MAHKFNVGQQVDFTPAKLSIPKSAGRYTVVRRMPLEDGEYKYRIKSLAESFERVAREGEISR